MPRLLECVDSTLRSLERFRPERSRRPESLREGEGCREVGAEGTLVSAACRGADGGGGAAFGFANRFDADGAGGGSMLVNDKDDTEAAAAWALLREMRASWRSRSARDRPLPIGDDGLAGRPDNGGRAAKLVDEARSRFIGSGPRLKGGRRGVS